MSHPTVRSLIFIFTLLSIHQCHAQTVNLEGGGSNRIATITGQDIGGTTYDVTFNYTGTFGDYDGSFTFTTSADATAALDAIATTVNAFGDVSGTRTDDVFVPFEDAGTQVSMRQGFNLASFNYSTWYAAQFTTALNDASVLPNNNAVLTFTTAPITAVPEPTSFALAGMLSLGAVVLRRRRRKIQAESK